MKFVSMIGTLLLITLIGFGVNLFGDKRPCFGYTTIYPNPPVKYVVQGAFRVLAVSLMTGVFSPFYLISKEFRQSRGASELNMSFWSGMKQMCGTCAVSDVCKRR